LRKLLALSVLAIFTLIATSTVQAKADKRSYVDAGLLCIHSYEGAWNDPNPPYWGGLQMDWNFQDAYGYMVVHKHTKHAKKIKFLTKWGTADHWPIWAQMIAGRHGYYARGWNPWPNTARVCGLI
jgi:hypothetical protein